jgi:hypothetical protein
MPARAVSLTVCAARMNRATPASTSASEARVSLAGGENPALTAALRRVLYFHIGAETSHFAHSVSGASAE